ncbi:MAG: methyltransferase domain-containing protein [Pyrinomonadaceae bacterium]
MESAKEPKSDKELAFLRDLYVMPDWGERFAVLLDEHLELPKAGRILYVEAGTGGHAMAVRERLENEVQLVCVDQNDDCLDLARAKATAIHAEIEFSQAEPDGLPFPDNEFDLVIGDTSLITPHRLQPVVAELGRVALPNGSVALTAATAGSFGEFFSIYWEALATSGLIDQGVDIQHLITELPTASDVEEMATRAGIESPTSWTNVEEFTFDSGEAFLNAPLITDFLLPYWIQPLPESARDSILAGIVSAIDDDRVEADFVMSVKATLVVGKKGIGG